MKVLKKIPREGKMKIRVETIDDLWYLSGIVKENDRVGAVTSRRDSTITDKVRDKAGERKTMFLTVLVASVEFVDFADRLRVTGTIVDGPLDLGQHHTLNVEVGETVDVTKDQWSVLEQQRVNEAVRRAAVPPLTLVCMDDEEAMITVVMDQGVRQVATILGRRTGKRDFGGRTKVAKDEGRAYYAELAEALASVGGENLLVAGPAFWKDQFVAYLKETGAPFAKRVQAVATSQAGHAGIQECLRNGQDKLLEETRAAADVRVMGRLLEEIGTDGKATYGMEPVRGALAAGAVEVLLIAEKHLRTGLLESMGKEAERIGAELRIVARQTDAGRQLESLGGVAAILRYRLPTGAPPGAPREKPRRPPR